jgi:hypothetical protein
MPDTKGYGASNSIPHMSPLQMHVLRFVRQSMLSWRGDMGLAAMIIVIF